MLNQRTETPKNVFCIYFRVSKHNRLAIRIVVSSFRFHAHVSVSFRTRAYSCCFTPRAHANAVSSAGRVHARVRESPSGFPVVKKIEKRIIKTRARRSFFENALVAYYNSPSVFTRSSNSFFKSQAKSWIRSTYS